MNNEEKLIKTLLAGVSEERNDIKIASLLAIGESGIIDEGLLVAALETEAQSVRTDVRIAAYTAIGRMLRNSNRQ